MYFKYNIYNVKACVVNGKMQNFSVNIIKKISINAGFLKL